MPTQFVDPLGHLPKALEVEEVRSIGGRRRKQGVRSGVSSAEGHGRMTAIGQADNDIRAGAVADADDGQLLSAERVMGMRDRHESRRELGRKGSALGMCLR